MTHLPPHLVTTLNRLQTAVNAIHALQKLDFAREFGKDEGQRKKDAALNTIELAVIKAAETIGFRPDEKRQMRTQLDALTDECSALRFTNARLREQIAQLTAANVRLMEQGRAA